MDRKYRVAGLVGAALILASGLLPQHGLSPLDAAFAAVFPAAAALLAALGAAAGAFVWRKRPGLAASLAVLAFLLGHSFFSRYYYPFGEGSLWTEQSQRAVSLPGFACLEVGLVLVLGGCLGLWLAGRFAASR